VKIQNQMYASKLVHNNNNWTSTSRLAQTGILVDINKKNHTISV
jgi:hypothetical protein